MIRPNSKGRITGAERFRASLSRWFFEDRISPITKGEIDQGGHH